MSLSSGWFHLQLTVPCFYPTWILNKRNLAQTENTWRGDGIAQKKHSRFPPCRHGFHSSDCLKKKLPQWKTLSRFQKLHRETNVDADVVVAVVVVERTFASNDSFKDAWRNFGTSFRAKLISAEFSNTSFSSFDGESNEKAAEMLQPTKRGGWGPIAKTFLQTSYASKLFGSLNTLDNNSCHFYQHT